MIIFAGNDSAGMIKTSLCRHLVTASLASLLLGSCMNTKYVPEGELLLNKVNVAIDNKEISREELSSYVRQRENTRILGFLKFHLWLYNLSSPEREEGWLKRAGEPPQIYNEGLAIQSRDQIAQYLHNKGYYDSRVTYQTSKQENRQKTDLEYQVATGNPYVIDSTRYSISQPEFLRLYQQEYKPRYFREGSRFDLDWLDRERDLITTFYKNRGYYYFSKPALFFEADTAVRSGSVDLALFIRLPEGALQDSARIFTPYKLNRFTFDLTPGSSGTAIDTVRSGRTLFLLPATNPYNPNLFLRLNRMAETSHYHQGYAESTFTALNRLRQFRFINISFQETPAGDTDSLLLDCTVGLSPLSRQSSSFDLEGTNTSGNLGIAGNLNYLHRNLFRGAEMLNLKLRGAMERQQAIVREEALDFNTRELGVEASLTVPKLIGPGGFFPASGSTLPKTIFTLGTNYQKRPDYTRTISTMRVGYEWMTSEYRRHTWNIMDFNMVNLSRFDPEFLNSIYDLYIRESFTDHLILATGYQFVYNTQPQQKKESYSYLKFSAESSGNLLYLVSGLLGVEKIAASDSSGVKSGSYYRILDTRYAQYVRGDIEFRKGYMLDKYNAVVGRLFFGVGLPYGNFEVLPFEKKYFSGGANGIRAWQVRSLGPGTYRAPEGSYPNQSGDIKLEANLEYRFKLIKFLEGAFFLDAGNIWAINEKDNRPGAQFKPGSFYRQLALGTGTGFRFDFSYFIFRLDLGMKMRDPAQVEHKGWITGARRLTGEDFNLSFAIGYPF